MTPERVGVSQAALITGMSPGVLSRLAKEGTLPGAEKIDGAWSFSPPALRQFMAEAEARVPIEALRRALAKKSPCRTYMRSLEIPRNKPDRVYFIAADSGHVKIGIAYNPRGRLMELQVGNPAPLRLLCSFVGGPAHEAYLHAYFAAERIRGEWFEASPRLLAFAASMERAR